MGDEEAVPSFEVRSEEGRYEMERTESDEGKRVTTPT